jgi:hypothetical protein
MNCRIKAMIQVQLPDAANPKVRQVPSIRRLAALGGAVTAHAAQRNTSRTMIDKACKRKSGGRIGGDTKDPLSRRSLYTGSDFIL